MGCPACCCLACSARLLGRCCSHSHCCGLQEARIASANYPPTLPHMPGRGRPDRRPKTLHVCKVHGIHAQGQCAVADLVWTSLLLRPASPVALSHRTSTRAAHEVQPTHGTRMTKVHSHIHAAAAALISHRRQQQHTPKSARMLTCRGL